MKKNVLTILLIVSLALIVSACASAPAPADSGAADAGSADSEAATEEPVTIEWIQWFANTMDEGSMDELIEMFEAEHPNINVKLVTLPFGETRNQTVAGAATGQLSDVIGMNPPWMGEFVSLGVLEPLDAYINGDNPLDNADELIQAPMATYEGSTWMLPQTAITFVLYYNKDLFEAAGLTDPPANWEEFREYAKLLTDAENDQYGYTMFMNEQPPANGSIINIYPLVYAAGGRTLVDGQPNLTSPEVVQALQLIKNLHDDGSVAPGTTSKSEVQAIEEFALGNIGMLIENTAHVNTMALRNPDLNYGIVPPPSPDGATEPQLRSHGWEIAMSSASEHKDAAWTFMKWLTTAEANSFLSEHSANIPGNTTADTSFYSDKPQLLDAIEIIGNYEMVEELMTMPKSTASWTELSKETIKMLVDDQSAEDTAANAQAAWEALNE